MTFHILSAGFYELLLLNNVEHQPILITITDRNWSKRRSASLIYIKTLFPLNFCYILVMEETVLKLQEMHFK